MLKAIETSDYPALLEEPVDDILVLEATS